MIVLEPVSLLVNCRDQHVPPRDCFDLSDFIKAAHVLDAYLVVSHLGYLCVVLLLISDIIIFIIFFFLVEAGGGFYMTFCGELTEYS